MILGGLVQLWLELVMVVTSLDRPRVPSSAFPSAAMIRGLGKVGESGSPSGGRWAVPIR